MAALLFSTCLLALAWHGAAEDDTCKSGGEDTCRSPEAESDGVEEDIRNSCPLFNSGLIPTIMSLAGKIVNATGLLEKVWLWPEGVSPAGWADTYTIWSYLFIARASLGLYKARNKDWVNVPWAEMLDRNDLIRVENVNVPHFDVDGNPNFYWFEPPTPNWVMKPLYTALLSCFYSVLRRMSTSEAQLLNSTFDDALDDLSQNTWEVALAGSRFKSKLDWAMSFYDMALASSWDGKSLWTAQMTNFQTYWKQDEWDDTLEYAIAFHLIGTHRVESGSYLFEDIPGLDTLKLPFRIALNLLSAFEVREHFGRYGVDMYFNEDGLPVLLQTPTGEYITRGGKQWQYWKFVWRCSLVTGITLIDHLHLTHFRVSNLLARVTRVALPPANPLRRLLSIFTFGAIFVNQQAMFTLVGSNHLLHRATPFKHFTALSKVVPGGESGIMPDVSDLREIKALIDDAEFEKLPPKLQAAPYYSDGRILMAAIKKMVLGVYGILDDLVCDANGGFVPDFARVHSEIWNETLESRYALPTNIRRGVSCKDAKEVLQLRLMAYIFVVTAYHRQVGNVGDYYRDPSLATMSWKDGETSGRPRQHMIMTYINVFTSTHQPFLREDYTHLFKGMLPDRESGMVAVWRAFQKDLADVEAEIDKRNEKREIPNTSMSPKFLECSVAK